MGIFAKETSHSSSLETTPARAWELMGDFSTYPTWNPLAPKLKGRAKAGRRAIGWLSLGPRWLKVPFWPKIVTADTERELRWRGGLPLLFTADHRMILDEADQRIRHEERFTGLLVLPVKPVLGLITRGVYKRFDRALNAAANKPLLEAGDADAGAGEPEEA
jgi:hypothetical protein